MSERLGPPDANLVRDTPIGEDDVVVLAIGMRVVRVHPLAGPHPVAWDELRSWGPTRSRFDHQTLPRRFHPSRRIAYCARDETAFPAALAEYYQDDGGGVLPIDLGHRRPAASIIELAAPVRLLDLDGGWITRAGDNQAIRTGSLGRSREWARAIYRHHPEVAGVAYGSSVWGPGRCVALWERAEPAFPAAPVATRTLDDPTMAGAVAAAAEVLGTYVL